MKNRQNCRSLPQSLLVLALAVVSVSPGVASGSIVAVTGGDRGEGFAPATNTFIAYDLLHSVYNQPTYLVQGVPFSDPQDGSSSGSFTAPSFSFSGGGPFNAAFSFPTQTTANDNNLAYVVSQGQYGSASGITMIISNMNPTQDYKIDVFMQDGPNAPRTNMTLTITGHTTVQDAGINAFQNPSTLTMVEEIMNPNASGVITLTLTGPAPYYEVVNAIAVTYVPEPASAALIGVGGLLVWLRRRVAARTA